MKVEQRDVFVADDGSVFATEAECKAHEEAMARRTAALRALKVRRVTHGFDAAEGRGYFAKTLIITDESSAALTQWCLDKFGPPLVPWYGDGYYEAWILSPHCESDTVEWALAHKGYKSFYGESPWEIAVVSTKDFQWAGLPPSQFPWPRLKPKAKTA